MNSKKWLLIFLSALVLVFVVWMGVNIVVDPFGVFGDFVFNWDSYSQTLNPRVSKVSYISEHFDEYDSYIIGSSSAASYDPKKLGEYTDSSFYNMFHYGADTEYDKQLVSYLLKNDDVENIFLVLGINEADILRSDDKKLTDHRHCKVTGENPVSFYFDYLFADFGYSIEKITSYFNDEPMPQNFDVFVAENGTYDKRVRDVESIGSLAAYTEKNGDDFYYASQDQSLKHIDECVANVLEIRKMCEQYGAKLTVVLSPVNINQLGGFNNETLDEYFNKLASVTDYWNFAISSVSYDHRYFYDVTHTRNDTADMVVAKIFNDDESFCPDNFGILCQSSFESTAQSLRLQASKTPQTSYTQNIPILLYHHLAKESDGSSTLSYAQFEHQLQLIKDNGYTTVTFDDIISFVENGKPLPEKPVIITFDDGYTSNYEYAYPLLKKCGFNATVFAIGSSLGKDYYKDTDNAIIPHFDASQALEMISDGVFSVQSHTYDMHQSKAYETGDTVRADILPLETESDADYIDFLSNDIRLQHTLFENSGLPVPTVAAFPGGKYETLTSVVLRSFGYKASVTTDDTRVNTLVCGLSQSLIELGRMNITSYTSDSQLLDYLTK